MVAGGDDAAVVFVVVVADLRNGVVGAAFGSGVAGWEVVGGRGRGVLVMERRERDGGRGSDRNGCD